MDTVFALRTRPSPSDLDGVVSWLHDRVEVYSDASRTAIVRKLINGPTYSLDIGLDGVGTALSVSVDGVHETGTVVEPPRKRPHLSFHQKDTPFYPYREHDDAAAVVERTKTFLRLLKRTYRALVVNDCPPAFVYALTPGLQEHLRNPEDSFSISRAEVFSGVPRQVFWGQIYSPRMVEPLGRRRLLSAPAWHTEQLPDQSVLLVLDETPSGYTGWDYSSEAVAAHLGLNDEAADSTQ